MFVWFRSMNILCRCMNIDGFQMSPKYPKHTMKRLLYSGPLTFREPATLTFGTGGKDSM